MTPPGPVIPTYLEHGEDAAWATYGEAARGGADAATRRVLFEKALGETERCLEIVRRQRDAEAKAQKKAQAAA